MIIFCQLKENLGFFTQLTEYCPILYASNGEFPTLLSILSNG